MVWKEPVTGEYSFKVNNKNKKNLNERTSLQENNNSLTWGVKDYTVVVTEVTDNLHIYSVSQNESKLANVSPKYVHGGGGPGFPKHECMLQDLWTEP